MQVNTILVVVYVALRFNSTIIVLTTMKVLSQCTQEKRLDGRTAAVTGGGHRARYGAHVASAGVLVVVLDSNIAAASDAADETGSGALGFRMDVTDYVLFNNAGTTAVELRWS